MVLGVLTAGAAMTATHEPALPQRAVAANVDAADAVAAAGDRAVIEAASRSQTADSSETTATTDTTVPEPVRLIRPAAGLMTGWFGEPRRSHFHAGMDIDGEIGDPVWTAGRGLVVHAGPAPQGYGGYGTTVIIDHGQGVQTVYAHLSEVLLVSGQQVTMAEPLGSIGVTGSITGAHLHFEVRVNGVQVDPADWIESSVEQPRPHGPRVPGGLL
jgi:murein DD-endopeptidase MepM/ murein hydrolase activator NlpD